MAWWDKPAPVEPPAVARGVVSVDYPGITCVACRTALPVDALTTLTITPQGGQPEVVHVCRNKQGCRLRAQDAGIYLNGGAS